MFTTSATPSAQGQTTSHALFPPKSVPGFTRLPLTCAVLLALGGGWSAAPAHAEKPERAVEGRLLVQTRAGLSEEALDKILRQQGHGGKAVRRLHKLNVHVVEVPPAKEEAVLQELAQNPHIEFVEWDRWVEPAVSPNDPYYSMQWHLPKIQAPNAWNTTLGLGVTVAVLDTGVDAAHPDLAGQLVPGWNVVDNTSDTNDTHGHGTQVAGAVAAATNNGVGMASVAGAAQMMPVRVSTLSDGSASISDIAEGLDWAAEHGATVANISYDITASPTVAEAAQRMRNNGGVVVVAAGNGGLNSGYSDSPYMLSVAATTSSDLRYSNSNYGNHVDLAAPGSGVWTTNRGGGYGSVNGTSIASPVVAGVVALVQSINSSLLPAEVEAILLDSSDDLGDPGWDPYYGRGRVNADRAMAAAVQALPDTQAPTAAITAPGNGATVSGLVPLNVSAADNRGTTRVDLYANGTLVASDATEPFAFSWDTSGLADGPATLVAYAVDAAGNQGASSPVSVTIDNVPEPLDTTPPTVSINNPANGSSHKRKAQVNIAVSASDNVGVTQLSCSVDGAVFGSTNSGNLSCTWTISNSATLGSHTISATARDAAGNSKNVSIQVNVTR